MFLLNRSKNIFSIEKTSILNLILVDLNCKKIMMALSRTII